MDLELLTKVILKVIEGPEKGKTFEFIEQDNFLVGRDAPGSQAHLRLSPYDPYVSRNHFLLEINPPDCYLSDAGSLNGTFVIRQDEKTVFFLEGRRKGVMELNAKELAEQFQCNSYQMVERSIKLQDGDMIKVGQTIIKVEMQNIPIEQQVIHMEEVLKCIKCGKDISVQIRAKEVKELGSNDFLCEECRKKQEKEKVVAPEEKFKCWGCGKDLTFIASSDGRALELKQIALYWCESCASQKQEDVPIHRIGKYRLLKVLGSGGFGIVFLAWDENTGRISALKFTKEKIKHNKLLLERFKREIAIMKELNHPNLVKLYDEGISKEDRYYFVSEYIPEGSLADLFEKKYHGVMPYKDACYFICQALDGLSYFHNFGQQYVHRDLKPENIFVRKDEKGEFIAKIGDFGLSRSYVVHGGTITRKGEYAGTYPYMPPEQITNFKNVKPSADIYAMGVTLYYLITGKFPYDFPTRKELLQMLSMGKKVRDPIEIILGDDKPIPVEKRQKEIPHELAKAINKAIQKDAKKRFQSAEEFKKAIEEYKK